MPAPGASPPTCSWPISCPRRWRRQLARNPRAGGGPGIAGAERADRLGADHRGRGDGGQPAGAGAPRDRHPRSRGGRRGRPSRRRHLPGRRHPRAGGRLHRRAEPRAAHRRHRAATPRRSGCTTSSGAPASSATPATGSTTTRPGSSRWRRRRGCTGTRRRCGCGCSRVDRAPVALSLDPAPLARSCVRMSTPPASTWTCRQAGPPIGRLRLVFGLTALFMVVEAVGGWLAGSLALLADAGHMLTDVGALGLTLLTAWIARRPADQTQDLRLSPVGDPGRAGQWRRCSSESRRWWCSRPSSRIEQPGADPGRPVPGGGRGRPAGERGRRSGCCTAATTSISTPAAPTSNPGRPAGFGRGGDRRR